MEAQQVILIKKMDTPYNLVALKLNLLGVILKFMLVLGMVRLFLVGHKILYG